MRTIGLAAAVAVVVAGIGLSLQTGVLPGATPGRVAAVRAVRWLERFRYAASTLELGGHHVRGRCYHGWFGGGGERSLHGTELVLGDGLSVQALENHLVTRGAQTLPPLNALELAGCTTILGSRLATLAVDAPAVTVERARFDGAPVLALHAERLTVLVSPRSDLPVGVELHGVRSSIRLLPLTPTRLEPFEPRV